MSWLVTGGAGYIGSHVTQAMCDAGIPVVVIDDLSTGFAEFVAPTATFVEGTLLDGELVGRVKLAECSFEMDGDSLLVSLKKAAGEGGAASGPHPKRKKALLEETARVAQLTAELEAASASRGSTSPATRL